MTVRSTSTEDKGCYAAGFFGGFFMRADTIALAVVAATATMWATPTQACSPFTDDTEGRVTFDTQTLPKNADLWITAVDDVISRDVELFVFDPAGEATTARLEREGTDARLVIDGGLSPGSWRFRVRSFGEDREAYDRNYRFDVADRDDTTPPAAPTVDIEVATIGGTPGFLRDFIDPCGPQERQTIRTIKIELPDADDVARVSIDGVTFNTSGRSVGVANREEDGSDVVVSVFDFAGNESEVVVVSVAGGGCATVPAVPASVLASVLIFMRRRQGAL